jgi:hypothetical protein
MSFFEEKIKNLVNALLVDLHCTPCKNYQEEKQLKLIFSLSQISYIQHEIMRKHNIETNA